MNGGCVALAEGVKQAQTKVAEPGSCGGLRVAKARSACTGWPSRPALGSGTGGRTSTAADLRPRRGSVQDAGGVKRGVADADGRVTKWRRRVGPLTARGQHDAQQSVVRFVGSTKNPHPRLFPKPSCLPIRASRSSRGGAAIASRNGQASRGWTSPRRQNSTCHRHPLRMKTLRIAPFQSNLKLTSCHRGLQEQADESARSSGELPAHVLLPVPTELTPEALGQEQSCRPSAGERGRTRTT